MTDGRRKFMKTTIWLRDARERLGGGVPSSGRSASLAVFGTIGCGGSVPPAEFAIVCRVHAHVASNLPAAMTLRESSRSLSPNMAKFDGGRTRVAQPL